MWQIVPEQHRALLTLATVTDNPAYSAKLTGSDENTGWTRLTGRVTLASNMAPSDAALFGVIVATVLLCLALDRFIAKRREARAKDSSDDSPLVQ